MKTRLAVLAVLLAAGPSPGSPPYPPLLLSPTNNAWGVTNSPALETQVSDQESTPMVVTFYGRPSPPEAGADFSIIALPDTQYYTAEMFGGTRGHFIAQTEWIISNRLARNIRFVTHLGDVSEWGDWAPEEWSRATNALYRLENPARAGGPDGIPYGVAVGNHDQILNGNPDGTTALYNQYFGVSHFNGRGYYGGHYGGNNDHHYELFSGGGLDFVILHLEYDESPDAPVMNWANGVLQTYSNRRAIVVRHYLAETGNPAAFSGQGFATYESLKTNANLFLMLCGHVLGEGRRQDTFNGRTVHTLLSDYQNYAHGGDGWLRIMEFSPSNNVIRVRTYSPTLNQWQTDADSQFDLPYLMTEGMTGFAALATNRDVASGTLTSVVWSNLAGEAWYEWYVTADDGLGVTASVHHRFRTGPAPDSDGDGLLYPWEMAHFGSLVHSATGDWDGDGADNRNEMIAGTVPTNAASFFAVAEVTGQGDGRC